MLMGEQSSDELSPCRRSSRQKPERRTLCEAAPLQRVYLLTAPCNAQQKTGPYPLPGGENVVIYKKKTIKFLPSPVRGKQKAACAEMKMKTYMISVGK